jgi:hypothetical protein
MNHINANKYYNIFVRLIKLKKNKLNKKKYAINWQLNNGLIRSPYKSKDK